MTPFIYLITHYFVYDKVPCASFSKPGLSCAIVFYALHLKGFVHLQVFKKTYQNLHVFLSFCDHAMPQPEFTCVLPFL